MHRITLQLPDDDPSRSHPAEVTLQPVPRNPPRYHYRVARASGLPKEPSEGEISILSTSDGEGRLMFDGRVMPFYFHRTPDAVQVWIDGQIYNFQTQIGSVGRGRDARATRSSGAAPPLVNGEITAPMPGTILKLAVRPGDRVEAGQPLVVMESMKMEITVSAPLAGLVSAVECREGQLVDIGALLIVLRESANG